MDLYQKPGPADSIFNDSKLQAACEQYEQTLKTNRLLPDNSAKIIRWLLLLAACLILVGVGGIKIYVALERGRSNIQFLIILMVGALIIASKVSFPRLTSLGKSMLADVQSLYSGLKDRASFIRPGGATIEPMMLAARLRPQRAGSRQRVRVYPNALPTAEGFRLIRLLMR